MVRVFKGNDTKMVTRGVFEQIFKPLGYQIVIENKKPMAKTVEKTEEPKEEIKTTVTKESSNDDAITEFVSARARRNIKKED